MPTQLQLEGAELEPLLDRVRSELGPGARIVQAEKVRTGGVAGFFARQRFELTVELPDDADQGTAPAPAAAPTRHATTALPPAAASPGAAASLLDLADQVSQEEQAAHVSTESSPFASLLSSLGSAVGDASPAATDPPPAVAGPVLVTSSSSAGPDGGATGRSSADVLRRALARRAPAVASPATPAAPDTSPPAPPPSQQLSPPPSQQPSQQPSEEPSQQPEQGPADQPSPQPEQATVVPAQRHSTAQRHPTAPRHPAADAGADALRAASTAVDPSGSRAVGSAARPPSEPSGGDAGAGLDTSAQLERLGLPAHLCPAVAGEGLYPALVDALGQLPKVPRTSNRAGGLLAVAGPLPLALEIAREIAQEMGLPVATAVVVATSSRTATGVDAKNVVRSLTAAAERRAVWRRRRHLTIVAVDAPLTSAGAAQGRDFLTALEPTATWGAVEATRKAHDVGTWSRALGGVHALALTGVEETADPAAVLELGIPVGRVGHRPATPAVWAGLLTGRLAS